MSEPMRPLQTVYRWSTLMAHSLLIPSRLFNTTSEGISRIVEVIGATVTSPRNWIAEFLVRISTGLSLSGWGNLYQRISFLSVDPNLFFLPPAEFTRFDRPSRVTASVFFLQFFDLQLAKGTPKCLARECGSGLAELTCGIVNCFDQIFLQGHWYRFHSVDDS